MFIYYCLGKSCLVVFVYNKLSSGSVQPPLLESALRTSNFELGTKSLFGDPDKPKQAQTPDKLLIKALTQ